MKIIADYSPNSITHVVRWVTCNYFQLFLWNPFLCSWKISILFFLEVCLDTTFSLFHQGLNHVSVATKLPLLILEPNVHPLKPQFRWNLHCFQSCCDSLSFYTVMAEIFLAQQQHFFDSFWVKYQSISKCQFCP